MIIKKQYFFKSNYSSYTNKKKLIRNFKRIYIKSNNNSNKIKNNKTYKFNKKNFKTLGVPVLNKYNKIFNLNIIL